MAFLPALGAVLAPEAMTAAESILGPEVASVLGPHALKAIEGLSKDKKVKKGFRHLANNLFGSKHGRTARKLLRKADKYGGIFAGKSAHKLLKGGLGLGTETGLINPGTAKKILTAHEKAMQLHDQLSHFNKNHLEGFGTSKADKMLSEHRNKLLSPPMKPVFTAM